MIRINLLPVARERAPQRVLVPAAHRVTIAATLILLATTIFIGWWFWSLQQQSQGLDQEIARVEEETRQIQSVLEQVRKFEAQKTVLQQRVSLIEQLRKGQAAPVQLLDEISRSLPERLWLNELSQTGSEFTMSGVTDSLTAVSDFVANLENTRWFQKPVEILDSQVQTDSTGADLIKFQVKAAFADPASVPAPAAPPASATAQ